MRGCCLISKRCPCIFFIPEAAVILAEFNFTALSCNRARRGSSFVRSLVPIDPDVVVHVACRHPMGPPNPTLSLENTHTHTHTEGRADLICERGPPFPFPSTPPSPQLMPKRNFACLKSRLLRPWLELAARVCCIRREVLYVLACVLCV